jgi:hypothetical protein
MGRPRVIVALILLCASAWFLTLPKLSPLPEELPVAAEPVTVFEKWFGTTCTTAQADSLVGNDDPALVARLEAGFTEGPPPELAAKWDADARAELEVLRQALGSGKSYGLNPSELESVRRLEWESYYADEKRDWELGYRSAALAGLGKIGSDETRGVLQRLVQEPGNEAYREAIRLALGQVYAEIAPRLKKKEVEKAPPEKPVR